MSAAEDPREPAPCPALGLVRLPLGNATPAWRHGIDVDNGDSYGRIGHRTADRPIGCLCYVAVMRAPGRLHLPSNLKRVIFVVLLAVIVFLISTARLFVWPPSDTPSHVDAIVALGGDPGRERMNSAFKLAKAGYAPIVVISLGGDPKVHCPRTPKGLEVICFRPDPVNTRGEAEFVARLAAQRHWHRIIVIPDRTQTTRARLLFKRCTANRPRDGARPGV